MEVLEHDWVEGACISLLQHMIMKRDIHSPKEADLEELWAHLKVRYKDGDEMVDNEGLIWDVWRKENGFALYCSETKEAIEVPRPEALGG